MKIQNLKIEQVFPYQKNNRIHSNQQVERIGNSIKKFGFNQPIVVDENNTILVGHGRLFAAQKLKLKEIPVLQIAGLSETDKRAYRILDNKLQNDSEWDFESLEIEIEKLKEEQFDLEAWGLDELEALASEDAEVIDDDFDATTCENQETFIKLGDLIELGEHRVMCVDCREAEPLPVKADMWLTDPPYGVSYIGKTKDALTIENDALGEEDTARLWRDATKYALDNLKDGGACYAAVPAGPLNFIFLREWIELLVCRQQLVWAKDSMVLGHSDYHYKHEPILYGWKPGAAHYFTADRTKTSVLEFSRPKRSEEHPTMKPLDLWGELISNSSQKGEVVLDTFLGSGTTLIAADQLGRICYGMEISPKYCHVIIERYKKYCEKAGKPFECKINGEPFKGGYGQETAA